MYRVRSNRLLDSLTILPLLAFTAFGGSQIARADAVLDWHEIAVNTISTASPPRPGPVGFVDMAVLHAAVYDAVQAINGKFKPYHVQIPGASGSPRRRRRPRLRTRCSSTSSPRRAHPSRLPTAIISLRRA